MPVPESLTPLLARLGFGVEAVAGWGVSAWAGLVAGWVALSLTKPSRGWFLVLVVTYAVMVALPCLAALLVGRYLHRRGAWRAPPVVRRIVGYLGTAAFLAAAIFAYLGGWPR